MGIFAGGLAVGKRDTSTVSPIELTDRILSLAFDRHVRDCPILRADSDIVAYVNSCRTEGKRIGFTNGVFDLVHPGHVSILRFARDHCDALIVGLNSDSSVRYLGKGDHRPINTELDRAAVLAAFEMVDAIVIFEKKTPLDLIKLITPDILVKGADYSIDEVVGSSFVLSHGGEVLLAPLEQGKSSSLVIQKVMSAK